MKASQRALVRSRSAVRMLPYAYTLTRAAFPAAISRLAIAWLVLPCCTPTVRPSRSSTDRTSGSRAVSTASA